MNKYSKIKPGAGVVLRRVAGESLLIPVRGELADLHSLYVLDGVAEHVWKRLDGTASVEKISASIADEYQRTPEEIQADCFEFLSGLLDAGLVEEVA